MHQHQIAVPLPGPHGNPKAYLREYKFRQPFHQAHRGLLWIVGLIVFSMACIAAIVSLDPTVKITDAAVALIAFGALVLGYEQWREARHEHSMEKYYDRLDIPNRRRESAASAVRKVMRHTSPELRNVDQDLLMYVCLELDNLEYVVEKYKLGYIQHEQACRGLRTFQQRCLSPEFRMLAKQRVRDRDYHPSTAKVVKKVCRVIDRLERQRVIARHRPAQVQRIRIVARPSGATLIHFAEAWALVIPAILMALRYHHRA